MTIGIYCITNEITGKQYIGQSIHIEERIKEHKYGKNIKTSYLENSIRKYGWENFSWIILYECAPNDLDDEEKKFINLYGTYDCGYNLTRGGELAGHGNPMHNPILREKNRRARIGFKWSDEVKLKLSKARTSTGFYGVIKEPCKYCKGGFIYQYGYLSDNKRRTIRASDIKKLEEKVLAKGLKWIIVNDNLAEKTIIESEEKRIASEKNCSTGIKHVIKHKDEDLNQGFEWRYQYQDNGKMKCFSCVSLEKLKEKVLAKGLEWVEYEHSVFNEYKDIVTLDRWM